MADSVDRVFSHALNTVNKIRTGSQKPPSATRLQLYGLYKQAMEGDVDGIMERPEGNSDEVHRAREKWDAWKQQNGLSRTEAKRRYITTLIDTMHKYASPSADSRELVAELEFVWDQVKSNVPSSSSSSPIQTLGSMGLHMPPHYPHLGSRTTFDSAERTSREQQRTHDDEAQDDDNRPLQIKSPMSQSEEDLEEDEADMDRDEFVDAPDSQYNPTSEDAAVQTNLTPQEPIPYATPKKPILKSKSLIPMPSAPPPAPQQESAADAKWRKRVEQALVKMTAEVAALREQLESRRLFSHSPRYVFFRSIWRFIWGSLKHIAIDVLILGLVLLYLRRKKDRRLEAGVRLLLGDAKAQVQKVGGAQLVKVKIPGLGGKKT